jgi:hypothetical protein
MLSTKAAALQAHRIIFKECEPDAVYIYDMDYVVKNISVNTLMIKLGVSGNSDWYKWVQLNDRE